MATDTGSGGRPGRDGGGDSDDDWFGFFRQVLGRVGIGLLALGGVVAFVGAVGGAIVWTRFRAAELPADQALDKLPQGELVATGAVTLALYGVLGLFAAVGVYLIDSPAAHDNDRRSRGLSRGLLLLVAMESLVVTALLIGEKGWARFGISAELSVLLLLLCLMITRAPTRWAKLGTGDRDQSYPGAREALWAFVRELFRRRTKAEREAEREAAEEVKKKEAEARAAQAMPAVPCKPIDAIDKDMQWFVIVVGLATVVLTLAAALAPDADASVSLRVVDVPLRPWGWEPTTPALIGLALLIVIPGIDFGQRWVDDGDTRRPSPESLYLRREGGLLLILFAGTAIAAPALVLWETWIAAALAVAVLLGGLAWLVASRADQNAFWYGIVIFASVPFLGAAAGIIRNVADPQVQPLALIHARDGRPAEAIQGIYVTETDDRLFFASVATDRCTGEVVDNSGRMLSVPRPEVTAMMLGPRQSVGDAGRKSVEMFQALTGTAAVAPEGPRLEVIGSPSVDESSAADADPDPLAERGLDEAAGPSLRREFTEDQSLSRDGARVGATVVLKGDDFDDDPDDRTVRIGGVLAPLADSSAADDIRAATAIAEKPVDGDTWTDNEIRFTVPENAVTGAVTLECKPLVGSLTLDVERTPQARFTVTPAADSPLLALDASGARDRGEGEIMTRSWKVRGRGERKGTRLTTDVSPGTGSRIALEVTDDDGDEDAAELTMWRLRVPGAVLDGSDPRNEQALSAIRRKLDDERGVQLVTYSHVAVSDGFGLDADLRSRQLAEQVEAALFGAESPPPNIARRPPVTFGDRCSPRLRAGPTGAAGQVDVFLLGRGSNVAPPRACR